MEPANLDVASTCITKIAMMPALIVQCASIQSLNKTTGIGEKQLVIVIVTAPAAVVVYIYAFRGTLD